MTYGECEVYVAELVMGTGRLHFTVLYFERQRLHVSTLLVGVRLWQPGGLSLAVHQAVGGLFTFCGFETVLH